jgi:uncharacterized OB-fold protein
MDVPRHWRLRKQRYSLAGEVCLKCQTLIFPPRAVCPVCGSENNAAAAVHSIDAYPVDANVIEEVSVKA